MFPLKKWLLIFGCSLFVVAAAASSNLNQINQSILTVQADLSTQESQLERAQQQLETSETALGQAEETLQQTQNDIAAENKLLANLTALQAQYVQQLQVQQQALAQHLQTTYILGRQPYIKMLLNQQNPYQISRIITYYSFINQQRLESIQKLQAVVTKIVNTENQIQLKTTHLQQLHQNALIEAAQLKKVQQQRTAAVTTLDQTIANKKLTLANLLASKKQLTSAVQQAETPLQPMEDYQGESLPQYKGKLPWPTRGKVLHLFNQPISNSQLRWNGILIVAPEGTSVRTIASGQVVFAKWLEGYGFLMIVNHGNGYLSLYGRNQILYKNVGDKVQAGDVVATVGKSGGYNTPALYFALMYNAKPLNPAQWCR